jgi:hypothetical protein
MKSVSSRFIVGLSLVAALAYLLLGGIAEAYETYHDPALDGDGYCAASGCHTGFPNRGPDHDVHVSELTSACNLCHTGSGRNNPYTMWSVDSANPYGCAGCHGRDYGETTAQSYFNGTGSINPAGAAKMSGYGLRKQHKNKGVTICENCHADVSQSFIQGEDISPPNYARTDVNITDSCNTDGTEDSSQPEPKGNDDLGLDNDGDTFIDGADTDCGAVAGPGEVSGSTLPQMLVTAHDKGLGNITISYGSACSTTDNSLEFGDLASVSSYTYAGRVCNIGNTGTYVWTYGAGSQFFLIVGDDGSIQGSYGLDSTGGERPPDATPCATWDLTGRCD